MIYHKTTDQLLKKLALISTGALELTTPDGKIRTFGDEANDNQVVKLTVKDWSVFPNIMRKGDIGFAEDYRAGKWETDDLNSLITLGLENKTAMHRLVTGNRMYRVFAMMSYLLRLNTVKGSKKNIHAHYDLGNDFYKLWLDPSMTYSSAYYKSEDETLIQAQHNKYDRMLNCMNATSGRLLEIGCGWGGLAERAIQKGDFDIKGVTLSEEQHEYAQERLGQSANIVLEDYRHQTGMYDNIISIEMFEAVGERYWSTYFEKLKSLLSKNGKAVIQTITMNENDFADYRKGGDFIRSYIFPGGMLPSVSKFQQEATKAGLKCENEFMFGQDYGKTLEVWLQNFDDQKQKVQSLGFDDGFIRLWRFYLAGCTGAFRTEQTNVMQVELTHA